MDPRKGSEQILLETHVHFAKVIPAKKKSGGGKLRHANTKFNKEFEEDSLGEPREAKGGFLATLGMANGNAYGKYEMHSKSEKRICLEQSLRLCPP
jgi:hypothetical protein